MRFAIANFPVLPSSWNRGAIMGRFKALAAAPSSEPTKSGRAGGTATLTVVAGDIAPERVRRLTRRTVPDADRYARLRDVGIRRPVGPLRSQAIERAALVQAHTRELDEVADAKACRVLARYLYDEGLVYGVVDEERALVREAVDRWLFRDDVFNRRAQRTYRTILYAAGRALYPNQFPEPHRSRGPRRKAVAPASEPLADELYAIVPSLSGSLRQQLLVILDLTAGAGLSAGEIRRLRGTDITALELQERTVVVVAVRKKGVVSRVVPVVCPIRGHRLLTRAQEAGGGFVFPCVGQTMPRNAICHVADRLDEQGFPRFNAAALRNRWVVDLATDPAIPAAMLLKLAGIADLRILHDLDESLPDYSSADIAHALLRTKEAAEV